jgi:hypothetical protein
MPRDGSNVYSIPPGTHGAPSTTIASTPYNSYVDDVAQDLNLPRPVSAGGTGGTSPATAAINLAVEQTAQVVTNWDSQVWMPGSFSAAVTATGIAPVAGHAFSGICYSSDLLPTPPLYTPVQQNIVLKATDLTDPVNPVDYIRVMKAGVWSPWSRSSTSGTSGSQLGEYSFDPTTITFPPTAGLLRFNNATQNSTTEIFISHLTANGVDITTSLPFSLRKGFSIIVQDKIDITKYKIFTAQADPVLSGGDFRILVRLASAGVDLVAAHVLLGANNGPNIGVMRKNYIINGAMMVSQENGTTAGTVNSYYPVDQFGQQCNINGIATSQQVASSTPGGSPNRIRFTATTAHATVAANDFLTINQVIEGLRGADLRFGSASAKTIIVQFGVKAPAGIYGVSVVNAAANRSYVAEYTIAAAEANTDVVKSVIVPGDVAGVWNVDSTIGMYVRWGLMAGTTFQQAAGAWGTTNGMGTSNQFNFMGTVNNVFELFDVGLYEGNVAPAFMVPDYASELVLCQRYWRFWLGGVFYIYATTGAVGYVSWPISPPMRIAPTAVFANVTYGNASAFGLNRAYVSTLTFNLTMTTAGGGYAVSDVSLNARL